MGQVVRLYFEFLLFGEDVLFLHDTWLRWHLFNMRQLAVGLLAVELILVDERAVQIGGVEGFVEVSPSILLRLLWLVVLQFFVYAIIAFAEKLVLVVEVVDDSFCIDPEILGFFQLQHRPREFSACKVELFLEARDTLGFAHVVATLQVGFDLLLVGKHHLVRPRKIDLGYFDLFLSTAHLPHLIREQHH